MPIASYALTDGEALILATAAALTGALVFVRKRRPAARPELVVAGVVGALLASSLVVAPITAWHLVSHTRTSARLSTRAAERFGAEEDHYDTSLTDRARAVIPPEATFWLTYSQRIDPARAQVFLFWSLPAMLPRKAVQDRREADWVMSWGASPASLGLPTDIVHVFRSRGDSDPPMYVARVTR